MDVDFYKGDVAVFMELAGERAVGSIRGDKGRQGGGAGVGEQECNLLQKAAVSAWVNEAAKHLLFTSATLLMFSPRSFSLNPRSLFRPKRTLSPSRR